MKLNYEKLIRSLDFANFVMFKHQIKSNNEPMKEIELTIPN